MRRALWLLVACLVGTAVPAVSASPPAAAGPASAVIAEDGAWCWFSEPRAVHVDGTTYLGWISSRGDITIGAYGPDGRTRTAVLMTGFEVNDHDHPSLLLRPDGRLQAFWSGHNGAEVYTRVTDRPADISRWSPVRTVPLKVAGDRVSTYTNPVYLRDERRLYLFGRSGYTGPAVTTSRDLGGTWTKSRRLIEVAEQRPYVKYASNGRDLIALAFTNGHPAETRASIYYAGYRAGALRSVTGRVIASLDQLPISPGQADLVYTPPVGRDAWVHDVALDAAGLPRLVFATMPHNAYDDHDYYYAAYDGTRWSVQRITAAGGSISDGRDPSYTAGISLDHQSPDTLVLSRPGASRFEVERWRTTDAGKTWRSEPLTLLSTQDNVRPVIPRGGNGRVVWMSGQYGTFTTFRTAVSSDQPAIPRLAVPSDLTASAATTSGGVVVSARLATGSAFPHGSKEVTLQRRPTGWRTWTRIMSAYTDADGSVQVSLAQRRGTEYRWVWPGDHDVAASETDPLSP